MMLFVGGNGLELQSIPLSEETLHESQTRGTFLNWDEYY
jgi:hypothetical protein